MPIGIGDTNKIPPVSSNNQAVPSFKQYCIRPIKKQFLWQWTRNGFNAAFSLTF